MPIIGLCYLFSSRAAALAKYVNMASAPARLMHSLTLTCAFHHHRFMFYIQSIYSALEQRPWQSKLKWHRLLHA